MAANLTTQVRSVALVVGAVARGDASQTVTFEAHGEMLAMKISSSPTVELGAGGSAKKLGFVITGAQHAREVGEVRLSVVGPAY